MEVYCRICEKSENNCPHGKERISNVLSEIAQAEEQFENQKSKRLFKKNKPKKVKLK